MPNHSRLNVDLETSKHHECLNSTTMTSLPYAQEEIISLKEALMVWLLEIGAFNGIFSYIPKHFEQTLDSIKNGTLLIKLVSVIFREELKGIHRKPLSYTNYVSNVRRVLDFLKKEKLMSTKFLWKVNDVVEGKESAIVGL